MIKLISLALALVCTLGLVGCFNTDKQPDNHGAAEGTKANLSEIAVEEPLDLEANTGVGVEIAFESDTMLIFYGDFGLFGYDLNAK